jgi:hypothetical protein
VNEHGAMTKQKLPITFVMGSLIVFKFHHRAPRASSG